MILFDRDIERLKAQLEKTNRKIPVCTGMHTQYFFSHKMGKGEPDGICGMRGVILDIREDKSLPNQGFRADLGILSHIHGFYVEYLNVEVLNITLEDEFGNKTHALCHLPDIETVMEVMNAKFRVNGKPSLRLVVDNSSKEE